MAHISWQGGRHMHSSNNQEVALAVLIDPPPIVSWRSATAKVDNWYSEAFSVARWLANRVQFQTSVLMSMPASKRGRYLSAIFERLGGRLNGSKRVEETTTRSSRPIDLYSLLIAAYPEYVPGEYSGSSLLLHARDNSARATTSLSRWKNLVKNLEIYEVPGDHHSIFNDANAESLAVRIAEALKAAQDSVLTLPKPPAKVSINRRTKAAKSSGNF